MVGINISFGNLREPDAPGPFYRPFERLPASFSIPGHSPSWINLPLGLLFIVVFVVQGAIVKFFSDLGVPADWTGTLAIGCVFLSFLIQPIVASLIRWYRTRVVHISADQVLIEYPNNSFAGSLATPIHEYRGLCRRWGTRYERRRAIKQEILELLHRDAERTIPVRVTEEYTTDNEELAALARQLGVDCLADSFKKSNPEDQPKPESTPSKPIRRQASNLSAPPKLVRLDERAGSTKFGTRLSFAFARNAFLFRLGLSAVSGIAFVTGWLLPNDFLLIFGGLYFVPMAWRTAVGKPGVSSLLIEKRAIALEPDQDSLMARLSGPKPPLEIVEIADIQDIYARQSQDGKRYELVLQTGTREIIVDLTLGRDGIYWVRDYLRQKL
eukprot:s1_g1325.t1